MPEHLPYCTLIRCDYCANGWACDCAHARGETDTHETWECAPHCPVQEAKP